jgi:hypothetical protein
MINHILLTGWLYIVRSTQYSKVWNGSGDQWRRLLRRLAIGRGDCRGVRQWQEDSLSLDRGWYMQNSCMKVLVYCCIFQQIKVLWNVIIMFCIDLWGFYIDPPYFGYIVYWSTGNSCFVYFDVSGTFRNSNWASLFLALLFVHDNELKMKKHTRGHQCPNETQ